MLIQNWGNRSKSLAPFSWPPARLVVAAVGEGMFCWQNDILESTGSVDSGLMK